MTRKEPLTATGAHISTIGHITLDEIRMRLTRTSMANGFANRYLLMLVKRSKLLPFAGENLPHAEIIRLGEKLRHIIDRILGDPLSPSPPRLFPLSETARAKWERAYRELSVEQPGLLGEIVARAESQVRRLSLIYALLDGANEIEVAHLDAALAVWEYAEASAMYVFGNALGDETADEIARMLDRVGSEGMSRSAIVNFFSRHRNVGPALALLQQYGRARYEQKRDTGGRPAEMWYSTTVKT